MRMMTATELKKDEEIWVGNGLLTEPGGFLFQINVDGTVTLCAAREDGRVDWVPTSVSEMVARAFAAQQGRQHEAR